APRIFCAIFSQAARWVVIVALEVNGTRFTPPDESESLWHMVQVFAITGFTDLSKPAWSTVFAAGADGGTSAPKRRPAEKVAVNRARTSNFKSGFSWADRGLRKPSERLYRKKSGPKGYLKALSNSHLAGPAVLSRV